MTVLVVFTFIMCIKYTCTSLYHLGLPAAACPGPVLGDSWGWTCVGLLEGDEVQAPRADAFPFACNAAFSLNFCCAVAPLGLPCPVCWTALVLAQLNKSKLRYGVLDTGVNTAGSLRLLPLLKDVCCT